MTFAESIDAFKQLSLITETPAPVDPLPVNTAPWKSSPGVTLYHGDCIEILKAMPARSVDAGVTDPPYGIGFMGREWDTFAPERARASKHFAIGHGDKGRKDSPNPNLRGRRQSPAMSPSQIEYDDSLDGQRGFQAFTEAWAREVYRVLKPGAYLVVCGAPRSHHRMMCGLEDAGFELRDCLAWLFGQGFPKSKNLTDADDLKTGWGMALKLGHEPIALARKPVTCTIEENVERWGVGALNIDGCRLDPGALIPGGSGGLSAGGSIHGGAPHMAGRWPANVVLDEAAAMQLDAQSNRSAGASRFYFVAKPSRSERDLGLASLPMLTPGECTDREEGSAGITPYAGAGRSGGGRNPHPTVKPVSLMRWLIRLVVPAGGIVLDPFLGSGTTGMAAAVDGYLFIGIERELAYLTVSDLRIAATLAEAVRA